MKPFKHVAATAAVAAATAGCLGPLVTDKPGASAHLLPAGTVVPSAIENLDLKVQLTLNDGLDDAAFTTNMGVVQRGTGKSAGADVRFWSFGPTTRAPSPIYVFCTKIEAGVCTPADHPPLLDALPGDYGYGAIHGINQVLMTGAYKGELITTMDALADAIELGLVEEPAPIKHFVDCPVVLPNTKLDVGGGAPPAMPETMFARGYTVTAFRFGGALGVQPIPGGAVLMPTSQVSFLRKMGGGIYDATHPIFQATIPAVMPGAMPNYTPLSAVVNVDLTVDPSMITQDSDLFTRAANGDITGTTSNVATFQVTTALQLLQLQFVDGMP